MHNRGPNQDFVCSAAPAEALRPIGLGGTSAERGETNRSVSEHYDNLTFCASENLGIFGDFLTFLAMVPKKVGLMLSKINAVNEGPQIVGTAVSAVLRPRPQPV